MGIQMVNMKRRIKNNQAKRPSIGRVMQLAEAICVSARFAAGVRDSVLLVQVQLKKKTSNLKFWKF